jgi:hypothetical protein
MNAVVSIWLDLPCNNGSRQKNAPFPMTQKWEKNFLLLLLNNSEPFMYLNKIYEKPDFEGNVA